MRRTLLASLLVTLAGCSLVMDTSPPDALEGGDSGVVRVRCTEASQCVDQDPCNGTETCGTDGYCAPGEPKVCLGAGCLVGRCLSDGSCIKEPDPTLCNDDVECTADHCGTDGACFHELDDSACDDGKACTQDLCVGVALGELTGGCYNLPRDSACPQLGVDGACVAATCDPLHNDPADDSGCVLRPLDNCEDGQFCDFATKQCAFLPDSCANGCDDGNPCNGVESCDTTGSVPVCVSTYGCPSDPNDSCVQTVCGEGFDGPYCATARVYSDTCLMPNLP